MHDPKLEENWKEEKKKKNRPENGYKPYSIDLLIMLNACCLSPISRMAKLLELCYYSQRIYANSPQHVVGSHVTV